MKHEVRVSLTFGSGPYDIEAQGAYLVRHEKEGDDLVVLVFRAEDESAVVMVHSTDGAKAVWTATPVE